MPHATLKFDLADPDDEREHRYALAGREALIALERIDERIRSIVKHETITEDADDLLRQVRAMIPAELIQLLH